MDEDMESVVSVMNVNNIGEGTVPPNRPGVYYEVDFDAITYDPDIQEVVDGTMAEVARFGTLVGIGPIDRLPHASQISDEYPAYGGESQQPASIESNQTFAVDDEIHARIVIKSTDERNPRSSKIGLAAKQPGLGEYDWPKSKRQQNGASAEGN